jgi:hypothetical protein
VRLIEEILKALREPVIAAGQSEITFHALLNDCPTSVAGHDEAVKIKVEASQRGTCPLCKGRSALPVLPAIASRKEIVGQI